jgi:hypothetical protein
LGSKVLRCSRKGQRERPGTDRLRFSVLLPAHRHGIDYICRQPRQSQRTMWEKPQFYCRMIWSCDRNFTSVSKRTRCSSSPYAAPVRVGRDIFSGTGKIQLASRPNTSTSSSHPSLRLRLTASILPQIVVRTGRTIDRKQASAGDVIPVTSSSRSEV